MQGTVKSYDPRLRSGSLMTDDAAEFEIDALAIEGSGLRLLRIGQRVDFEASEVDGRAVARSLKIPTF